MKNKEKMVNGVIVVLLISTLLGAGAYFTREREVVSAETGIVYSINYKNEICDLVSGYIQDERGFLVEELSNCAKGDGILMTDGNTYYFDSGRIGTCYVNGVEIVVFVKKDDKLYAYVSRDH